MKHYRDTVENYSKNGIPHPCDGCYECLSKNGCVCEDKVAECNAIEKKVLEHKRKQEDKADGR